MEDKHHDVKPKRHSMIPRLGYLVSVTGELGDVKHFFEFKSRRWWPEPSKNLAHCQNLGHQLFEQEGNTIGAKGYYFLQGRKED